MPSIHSLPDDRHIGRSFELPVKGKAGTHTLYEVLGLNSD
jgi:hypothetical protein